MQKLVVYQLFTRFQTTSITSFLKSAFENSGYEGKLFRSWETSSQTLGFAIGFFLFLKNEQNPRICYTVWSGPSVCLCLHFITEKSRPAFSPPLSKRSESTLSVPNSRHQLCPRTKLTAWSPEEIESQLIRSWIRFKKTSKVFATEV